MERWSPCPEGNPPLKPRDDARRYYHDSKQAQKRLLEIHADNRQLKRKWEAATAADINKEENTTKSQKMRGSRKGAAEVTKEEKPTKSQNMRGSRVGASIHRSSNAEGVWRGLGARQGSETAGKAKTQDAAYGSARADRGARYVWHGGGDGSTTSGKAKAKVPASGTTRAHPSATAARGIFAVARVADDSADPGGVGYFLADVTNFNAECNSFSVEPFVLDNDGGSGSTYNTFYRVLDTPQTVLWDDLKLLPDGVACEDDDSNLRVSIPVDTQLSSFFDGRETPRQDGVMRAKGHGVVVGKWADARGGQARRGASRATDAAGARRRSASAEAACGRTPASGLRIVGTWTAVLEGRAREGGGGGDSRVSDGDGGRPRAATARGAREQTIAPGPLIVGTWTAAKAGRPKEGEGDGGSRVSDADGGRPRAATARGARAHTPAPGPLIVGTWTAAKGGRGREGGNSRDSQAPEFDGARPPAQTTGGTTTAPGFRVIGKWIAEEAVMAKRGGGGRALRLPDAGAGSAALGSEPAADMKPPPGLHIVGTWTAAKPGRIWSGRDGRGPTLPGKGAASAVAAAGSPCDTSSTHDVRAGTTLTAVGGALSRKRTSSLPRNPTSSSPREASSRHPTAVVRGRSAVDERAAPSVSPFRLEPARRPTGTALSPRATIPKPKKLVGNWKDNSAFNALTSLMICRREIGGFDEDVDVTPMARRYLRHLQALSDNMHADVGQPRNMKVPCVDVALRNSRDL